MVQLNSIPNIEEDLVRHLILNSLRAIRTKHKHQYGELVICCDGNDLWRKQVFPYYKAKRKAVRDNSSIDWNMLYGAVNKVKAELTEFFPYPVLTVPQLEADDIIGILAQHATEPTLVVSNDEDFLQLLALPLVKQYSPRKELMMKVDDPADHLYLKILGGDSGDGVPNVLSPDDVFVDPNKRQSPLTKKRIDEIRAGSLQGFPWQENFERNKRLISLYETPEEFYHQVVATYEDYQPNGRAGLLNYFMQNRLTNLIKDIGEF